MALQKSSHLFVSSPACERCKRPAFHHRLTWKNRRAWTERRQLSAFRLPLSAPLMAQRSPVHPNPKERQPRIHRSRSITSATKVSIGIASQGFPYANIEAGRGRDGYGSMGLILRNTALAADSGFAKCVTRRRRRSPICTMLHPPAKQMAIWKTFTASIETDQCHHRGRNSAPLST